MRRIAIFGCGAVLAGLVVGGCASSPQQQAMNQLAGDRQQMDEVRGQVDRTMYTLDNLTRAPAAEIRSAQEQYTANVKALRKTSDQLAQGAQDMRARKVDYLTEWERAQLNVESADLKRASEQRRQQVVQSLTSLESSMQSANEGLQPLLAKLEDVERVVSNDPTPAGIAAVKKSGIVQAAKKQAATANYRLDLVASRFDRTLASLSPQPGTRPVAAAAPPTAAATAFSSFKEADRNASGVIEPDEVGQIPGFDFASADRNKDGTLSENEYEAAKKAGSAIGANASAPASTR